MTDDRGTSALRQVLCVVLLIVFVLTMTINALASSGNNFLFKYSTGQISDLYLTHLTPAGWTFTIWGVIYFFVATWLVYIASLFLRRDDAATRLYVKAPATHPIFLCALICALVLDMAWLGLFAGQHLVAAAVVLALLLCATWTALMHNYLSVFRAGPELYSHRKWDLWFYRLAVQNGLEAFGAWVLVACLVNVSVCLQHVQLWTPRDSALACLAALLVFLLILFPLENFVPRFEPVCRYGCLHYAVFAWAMAGVFSRLVARRRPPFIAPAAMENDDVIDAFVVTLLALSSALFVARVALIVRRHRTRPLYSAF